jgi:hypothetical protein
VPKGAAACEECGACARSGWKDNADVYDGLDLPDEEFDYDEFVAREFGGKSRGKAQQKSLWWWVALALVIVMVLGYVLAR